VTAGALGLAARWRGAPAWVRSSVSVAAVAAGTLAAWGATVVLAARPVPIGVVAQGAVQGALVALTAMGLVLVYRAARVVNFSQAAVGGIAASLAELAVVGWHVDVWLALALGLVAAAAVGVVVHATVVRRLERSSRLVVTVATIGLLQVLSVANGFVPDLAGHVAEATTFVLPFTGIRSIGGVPFGGASTAALVAVPVALGGLWWFLERSATGTAVRACADAPERAALLGLPVRRVGAVVWALAGLLSGLGSVLLVAIDHTPLGLPLTPEDLFPALAAFVLAGFDSLPAALGWSLVIGVVDDAVFWVYQNGTDAEVAIFVLVVVGLVVQRGRATRAAPDLGELVPTRRVPPLPPELAALPVVRYGRRVLAVAAVAAAVLVPLVLDPAQVDLVTAVPVYAIMALSLVVLAGWAGQVSLGQFAFGGIGAIVAGVLLVHVGADLFVALTAAVVVCALVAVAVGSVTVRLPGLTLAAVTMAFAVAVSDWLLSSASFPYLNPQPVPRPVLFGRFPMGPDHPLVFYELCLVLLLVALAVVRNLRRSHHGRAIVAARDDRRGTAAHGVEPNRAVAVALAVSGGLAGLGGALYLVQLGGFGSGGLTPSDSVTVFVVAVVGGLVSPLGAVAGAVVFECVAHLVSPGLQQLATGAGVLVFLLFLPEGIGGVASRARSWAVGVAARRLSPATSEAAPSSARPVGYGPAADLVSGALTAAGFSVAAPDPGGPSVAVDGDGAADRAGRAVAVDDGLPPGPVVDGDGAADRAGRGVPVDAGAPGAPASGLAVRGLAVAIGGTPIVRRLDLQVPNGTVVAVLGTNGAGKSTALRAIAGAMPAVSGVVTVDGVDVSGMAIHQRVRRGVVLVPGGRGVFPSLSVRDNLRLARWCARRRDVGVGAVAEAEDRVGALFPRLAERAAVAAGDLSGGEQQMLALAMGMLSVPSVLLVDELSLGLAPSVVAELLRAVGDLAERGVAVVVVEQSLATAATVARQAVFVERGVARYRGPMDGLVDRVDLVRSVLLADRPGGVGAPGGAEGAGAAGTAGTGVSVRGGRAEVVRTGDRAADGVRTGDRRAEVVRTGDRRADGVRTGDRRADGVRTGDRRTDGVRTGGRRTDGVPALEVVDLRRRYGGVQAVSGVSFSVAPGEIVGLVGANGAGKTTVLDLVSGLLPADGGRVLLGGVDVSGASAARRAAAGLGRVFQGGALFPALTVAEAARLALGRRLAVRDPFLALWWTAAVRFAEEDVADEACRVLASVGLDGATHQLTAELSTGMRRLVELACASAVGPSVLLLDEPTAGLARPEGEELVGRLRRLRAEEGTALVVVEHDVDLLARLADRLVCLHLGQVIADGEPEAVLADPAVVSAYVGTSEVVRGPGWRADAVRTGTGPGPGATGSAPRPVGTAFGARVGASGSPGAPAP
jgi:branched-chain amino acid transport system permease protein